MSNSADPTVSIIVPVRNEASNIRIILEQCIAQDYPSHLVEILVVDGLSTDGTPEIVHALAADVPRIRLVEDRGRQRTTGLNEAILSASGEIVVRLDARSRVATDYVRRCVEILLREAADNVGGRMRLVPHTETQRAIALAMSHRLGAGQVTFRVGGVSGPTETVYPGVFRRQVFERVGLFDDKATVMSEDSDMNLRIRRAGGLVYFDSSVEVGYVPRETIADLARLYYRYGGAKAAFVLKHGVMKWRQFFPAALCLLVVSSILILPFAPKWAAIGGLAFAFYLLVCVAVSVQVTAQQPVRMTAQVFACFLSMHLAYGVGFIRRLVEFNRSEYWG